MESSNNIPDGIYYLVLADLVDSTKFAARMGNAAYTARVDTFVEACRKALENAQRSSNSGRFVKTVGDAVLVVFNHFPDVIQWDMEFDGTLGLAEIHNEPFLRRTCVHVGEIRFKAGDPSSLAVNQIFKMEKQVRAGALVLTSVAHDLALASVYPKQCEFEDCGTVSLEGYTRPVKLHRLIIKADIAFLINKSAAQALTLAPLENAPAQSAMSR